MGPSLHILFLSTVSRILPHVWKRWRKRLGVDLQAFKDISCSEGQAHCGWGLWPCYLKSEATFPQSFHLIKELVVLEQQLSSGGLFMMPSMMRLSSHTVLDSLASVKMVVFLCRITRNTNNPVSACDSMHLTGPEKCQQQTLSLFIALGLSFSDPDRKGWFQLDICTCRRPLRVLLI